MRYEFRDPVSGFTHVAGALLGIVVLIVLVYRAATLGTAWHVVSFTAFGVSLILLYSSSALYHLLDVSDSTRAVMRRVDHTMIFLLIAGSYTPFCLIPLRGAWGWSILGVVWVCTIGGILKSIFWINAPRWWSTGVYVFIGWIAVIAIYPLYLALSSDSFSWLVAGGLFYTFGAIIYGTKWPDPFPPVFGFHEIWHLFVLAGSTCHVMAVNALLPH